MFKIKSFKNLAMLGLLAVSVAACGGGANDQFNATGGGSGGTSGGDTGGNTGGGTGGSTPSLSSNYSTNPTSGMVGVTVEFTASDTDATSYEWDFGDGTTGSGQSVSHTYNAVGTYTTSLTVTDDSGSVANMRNVYVLASLDNSAVIVPNNVLFYDDFEYSVSRSGDSATNFNNAGWHYVKAINITGRHAGYLYTVPNIPGYSGTFPGRNSNSVLAIENASATIGQQSDFYLQYGDASDGIDAIPGDVWIQFWIYLNHYDDPNNINDQMSQFDNGFKFIYPTSCGYPSRCRKWIYGLGTYSDEPYWDHLGWGSPDLYSRFNTEVGTARYALAAPWNAWKLGQQDLSERIVSNRWTLVKLHIDTSTSFGKYELWYKPMGGAWNKAAHWEHGVTPDLDWIIPDADIGGEHAFRMPTTVDPNFDWWMYMDDFSMATSEDALPQYPY